MCRPGRGPPHTHGPNKVGGGPGASLGGGIKEGKQATGPGVSQPLGKPAAPAASVLGRWRTAQRPPVGGAAGHSDGITSGINKDRHFLNPSARLATCYQPLEEHFTDCVSRPRLDCFLHSETSSVSRTKVGRKIQGQRNKAAELPGTTTRGAHPLDPVKQHWPDWTASTVICLYGLVIDYPQKSTLFQNKNNPFSLLFTPS